MNALLTPLLQDYLPLVVFIGKEMLWDLGVANGGAHEAVACQADLQAIPEHGASAEDARQALAPAREGL